MDVKLLDLASIFLYKILRIPTQCNINNLLHMFLYILTTISTNFSIVLIIYIMRTIKALFTAAAVTAISVVLAASAMAATTTLESSAYDNDAGTIDATGYTATDGQMTAIVVEASKWNAIGETDLTVDDLLYINQFDSDDAEATLTNIGLKGLLTEDVEYYVLLGGDNAEDIQILSITYKTTATEPEYIQLGECDGRPEQIDSRDALMVLSHIAGTVTLEGDALTAAECDGRPDQIDSRDALAILSHVAGTLVLGTVAK